MHLSRHLAPLRPLCVPPPCHRRPPSRPAPSWPPQAVLCRAAEEPRVSHVTPRGPKRKTLFGEEDDDVDDEGNVIDVDAFEKDPALEKQTAPDPILEPLSREVRARKGRVLRAIFEAEDRAEAVLRENMGEVDAALIRLLEMRLDAAKRFGEDPAYVRVMEVTLRRLLAILDKKNETAAERLLDACLQALVRLADDDEEGKGERSVEAVQEVERLLRRAFFPGLSDVDIFQVAELLAEGGDSAAAAELSGAEFVDKGAFLAEAGAIQAFAEGEVEKLENALALYAEGEAPLGLEDAHEDKVASLALLRGVMEVAERIELPTVAQ